MQNKLLFLRTYSLVPHSGDTKDEHLGAGKMVQQLKGNCYQV